MINPNYTPKVFQVKFRIRPAYIARLEEARRTGYLVARRHQRKLKDTWWGMCCARRQPYIVLCPFVTRGLVSVDFDPVCGFSGIFYLSDEETKALRRLNASYVNRRNRFDLWGSELSPRIPLDQAHQLARQLVIMAGFIAASWGGR